MPRSSSHAKAATGDDRAHYAPLMDHADRALLANRLLDRPDEARALLAQLKRFPWDCDEELALLGRDRMVHVLDRFVAGSLSPGQVEEWAEAIEVRDDIGTDALGHDLLREIIFELANPLLIGTNLTHSRAKDLATRLRNLDR